MRIAIMAAWNTNSGVAMHAEPIGKAFREMGHKLDVFSFLKTDYHGEGITAKDESFVCRCFGTRTGTQVLDPVPFMDKKYDILLVEDFGMLPVDKLANLMPCIKKKAKVVHVVHENRMCAHSWFYKIQWDKVVYFDHRQDFLKKVYPDAEYIPFPCYKIRRGNKAAARKRLGLPLNKKIIYSFGLRGYHPYYRELPSKLKRKAILLHILPKEYQMLEELSPTEWRVVRKADSLTTKDFDDYLFASDAAVFHKFQSRFHAVISSTVYQALGTGCPIFVPRQSDFFHDWKDEVIHYRDITALDKTIVDLLGNEKKIKRLREKADRFVESHSPKTTAKKYIALFERLLSE
jgi:glycosyltransferase involved in cell wall biosynthesis